MKRFFVFLLATCIMFSTVGFLSACDDNQTPHEHAFSQNWTKDADYHWHGCEGVGCNEISNKQAHDYTGAQSNTCSVCGYVNGEEEQPAFNGSVTKEQWDLAVIAEKFNNVTISYGFSHAQMGEVKAEILIAGDKTYKKMNDSGLMVGYAGEQAKLQKDMVLDLFMGLIAKYESFTYNEQERVYTSTETVTTTVVDEISGYTSIETMTNGRVKFRSDYSIEWLTCDMTEDIYRNGEFQYSGQYNDMIFEFKDFGTTIVDFRVEVPNIPQANYTQVTNEQWAGSMNVNFDCQINQTVTVLVNGEFYYVMEDIYIHSGNVTKNGDWYLSVEGDKYFEYYPNEAGKWCKREIEEEQYNMQATFAEFINAYDIATFDAETGLYVCDELEVYEGEYYYNIKIGFVDGKLSYLYYEEDTNDGMKAVNQYYFEFKTIEVNLPIVA